MVIALTPLADLVNALRTDQLDLTAYLSSLCDRIAAFDPQIQALLPEPGRRARLMREATAIRERFPDPATRPSLYGIPVGVKDIFRVDEFSTRAGSRLPPELFDGPEASCVKALREGGAIILGKTVTTEFAFFEPGPTRNPHNFAHTPGGSSSGSAAAVAAGFCPLAIGTQTIGSVIRPAAFCGVVGFKPTFDRIPVDGLIPWSPSADHVGLFAPDVAGVAIAAALLCREWRAQELTWPVALPRLGVPDGPYLAQASAEALAAFEAQLERLASAGYTIRRVAALEDIAAINHHHRALTIAEAAQVHADWFARYADLYRPRTAAALREGQTISAAALAEARASQPELRARLEGLMAEYEIDLWVTPAAVGPAPEGLGSTGDPSMSLPWTHAGLPSIAIPAGMAANHMPLGMQCVARFMADEQLLGWAGLIADLFK